MRVYSFVPSATEILYALGLGSELAGVTHECDYPPDARTKPVAIRPLLETSGLSQKEIDDGVVQSMAHGHGLYTIDEELLRAEPPDVVFTQELCDVCSVSLRDVLRTVSELSRACKVVSLNPTGLAGVLEDIQTVGDACGAREAASDLVSSLEGRVRRVSATSSGLERRRVFCVEWYDPVFASGHWVPEMVWMAGGLDSLGSAGKDSRKISWDQVVSYDPEVLVLMPCGFGLGRAIQDLPLLTRLPGWGSITAVRSGRVFAADASAYFSRPGPRLVDGLELLSRMLHPERFGSDLPPERAVPVGAPLLGGGQ